jgi:hypothetical protein
MFKNNKFDKQKISKIKVCHEYRGCIHYYSILAAFLSDAQLSKEYESVLFKVKSKPV